MDEADLIRRGQAGDLTALEELYRMYRVQAYRTACVIMQDSQLGEDMVQEAFIRALRGIGHFELGRPFAPWLIRIVINQCRTTLRERQRQVPVAVVPEESQPEAGYSAAEAQVDVRRALRRLDPAHQDVLMLRYYHQFTDAEIAMALEIPVGTVKSRLHLARRQLERLLGKASTADAYTCEEGLR